MANEGMETLEERMQRQGMPIAVEGAEYPGEVLFSTVSADSPTALYKAGKISREEYEAMARDAFFGASTLGGTGGAQVAENEDGGPGSGNWGHAGRPGQKETNEDAADTDECAAVLVVRGGYVLCGDRKDGKGVCGPGGHVQEGESSAEAAVREAQEEFGITPLEITPYGRLDGSTGLYRDTVLYVTDSFDGEPQTDGEEMSGARWMSLGELWKEELFPAFEDGIKILLKRLKIGENTLTNSRKNDTISIKQTSSDGEVNSDSYPRHKGRPNKRGGSLPRLEAGKITEALKSGVISSEVDWKKQSKHFYGSKSYNKATSRGTRVSYMTIGRKEIQEIVENFAGTGIGYGNGKQFKEVIDAERVAGIFLSEKGGESDKGEKTTRLTIHYAKDGCHVVPAQPKKEG